MAASRSSFKLQVLEMTPELWSGTWNIPVNLWSSRIGKSTPTCMTAAIYLLAITNKSVT